MSDVAEAGAADPGPTGGPHHRRPPTLGDVADLAGVSLSTVSNVVRGADVVAPATRLRVEAAVEQLGYRPNALARQLLTGRATTIGIIARDLANPFIAEMASLVEREAAKRGLATMFCATTDAPDGEVRAVDVMLDNRIRGVVLLSYLRRPAAIEARIGGRFTSMFIAAEEPWADSVTVDERRGGEIAAQHLLDLGHRRLAFVGPHRRDRADSRRLEGFTRAARVAGIRPTVIAWDPPQGPPTLGSRPTDWSELFRGDDHATGFFAANDFAAIDLLDAADMLTVRVPEDVSVIGFDDVAMAQLRRIRLTTVGQPRDELVRAGVETLLDRISGRATGHVRRVEVPVELKVRGTTGPPPGGRSRGALATLQRPKADTIVSR
jgi:LacI family transcriptional regulator